MVETHELGGSAVVVDRATPKATSNTSMPLLLIASLSLSLSLVLYPHTHACISLCICVPIKKEFNFFILCTKNIVYSYLQYYVARRRSSGQ